MKEEVISWKKRIIRIQEDYIKLCDYIDFLASKKKVDNRKLMSDIFSYSLNRITENGFNYNIDIYEPRRIPKGFTIEKRVFDEFEDTYKFYERYMLKKHSRKFYIGEFTELLLYIYCVNNFSKAEIQQVGIKWGIEET